MKSFLPTLKRYMLIWLVLILLIVGFGSLAVGEARRWWSLRQETHRAQSETEKIEERVKKLSNELELVTDPAYLEQEARRNLNVKREGEEVFVVVGLESIKQEEHFSLVSSEPVEEKGEVWENVKSWWAYFFR